MHYARRTILDDSYQIVDKALYIPPIHPNKGPATGRYGKLVNLDLSPINDEWCLGEHQAYEQINDLAQINVAQLSVVEYSKPLVYLGIMYRHFGHFIIESLSRAWYLQHETEPVNYLVHDNHWNFGQSFSNIWTDPSESIRSILATIGVDRENVVNFDDYCIVSNVILPRPSITLMQPNNSQYTSDKYKEYMQWLGRKFTTVESDSNLRPMYLSRSALGTADADVQQFELYLEDCLRTYVDIVYPEQLTLHEQIAQFKSRKYIMGKIGSALHLALFCDGGKRLSILVDREVTPSMHSYFKSLDALYDNSATYTNSTAIGTRQDAQSLADQLLSTLYKG